MHRCIKKVNFELWAMGTDPSRVEVQIERTSTSEAQGTRAPHLPPPPTLLPDALEMEERRAGMGGGTPPPPPVVTVTELT